MQATYNTHSLRSHQARLARRLGSRWLRLGLLIVGLMLASWLISGLVLHQSVAWLALVGLWPILLLMGWYDYGLKDLPPTRSPQSIDDALEAGLLALLPAQASARRLAELVMQTNGGQFFAIRFGVGPNFLGQLLSDDPAQTTAVWQEAIAISDRLNSTKISSAMVAAALIRTCPNVDQLLAHVQIDSNDILSGADWQQHIADLIDHESQYKPGGGIGRDWSFGYTPMLDRFGVNISRQVERGGLFVRPIEGHQQVLDQMANALTSGHQNAALVGPLGVGKTTIIYAFAERLLNPTGDLPRNLRYRQVVSLDAGSLISQAHGRGELEELVSHLLYEAYAAKNIVLCLDDAELFFEEGVGSIDLTKLLQPILEGGSLRLVVTMDEQRLLQIGQRNPGLIRTLNRINVTPPGKQDVLHILQDQLIIFEFQNKVTYMYQALLEAYRLGERYVYDQAMPGKALKLLEAAVSFTSTGLVTAASVQQAIEKTAGVKVANASDDDEREKLLNLEALIHERMINQTRAVQVVSDALRRARAGVRNPDRPIGTFLFLGPTGVGKTELAKSIAAVYFGGEEKMVRLDLNEYVQASDVARLIANGATDPNSLSAQIAKQPFSVVLLDEIEKAAPEVLGTLLQVLDEGVLRDIDNRQISFKDAIIVATSNAGADIIRAHIEAGQAVENFEKGLVDELINRQTFRPEFLNRFDEIVVFRELTTDELLQVVDLLLGAVNKNLALQKVSVSVADDAKRRLVQLGYDPRLGARPMRRIVQRTVENIVAKRMLSGDVTPGQTITITIEDLAAVEPPSSAQS